MSTYMEREGGNGVKEDAWVLGLYKGLGDSGDLGEKEECRGEIDLIWDVLD